METREGDGRKASRGGREEEVELILLSLCSRAAGLRNLGAVMLWVRCEERKIFV